MKLNQENIEVSFSKLFSDCQDRFIHFANTYVCDRMVAEDIVMYAFTYYWENRDRLQNHTNPQAYMLTTIKNRCLNYLRDVQNYQFISEKIKKHAEWKQSVKIATLEACDPEELFSKEVYERINLALDKLSEKNRKIFVKCRFEEKTYREVAEEMNLSVKGVEYHLNKAAESLRKSLKDLQPILLWLLSI